MTDEQRDRFNQEGGDGTEINACEKCGLSADCIHDGAWLCVEHAVEEWFDELQDNIDPAEIMFEVEYDVRVDDYEHLMGFTAKWECGGTFEGFITLVTLKEIRKELKR